MFVGMSMGIVELSRDQVLSVRLGTAELGVVLGQSSRFNVQCAEFLLHIVGMHIRTLRVTISQTHVAHGHIHVQT